MSLQWHYLDSQGTEFGPFDGEKMRSWFDQGFFQIAGENLLVRLPEWRSHQRLTEVYAGDRAAYFVTPPKQADGRGYLRDRSRSPRGRHSAYDCHNSCDAADGYRRNSPSAPSHYASPPAATPPHCGCGPHWQQNGYHAPHVAWGHVPPAPWGPHPPPFMGHGPAPPPYGWAVPPAGQPAGPYGYWDAFGPRVPPPQPYGYSHLPVCDYRPTFGGDQNGEDFAERNRRSNGTVPKPSSAEEDQAELRKLGPDGVRDMLVRTLESLYKDRIKPMANYVKGRLKERSSPEAVVRAFVDLYSQHADLFRVQDNAGSEEAAVFFASEPPWFKGWVDIDAADDPYDENMWQELKKFLEGGHTFAGGRYGMARELMQRNLSFLAPYSLGEVCHIVQLAIQQRKIIVYHKKMLKPMQPTLCQPAPTNGAGSLDLEEIATLFQLCRVLFKTLKSHPQGIRLDRMKQMIKEECSCRLNEMAFQCTKLIELFRQEPLKSTFALENDGKAFYVRAGDPRLFSEEVQRIYTEVKDGDGPGKSATQSN